MGVVAVDGVAAQCAYAAADDSSGQRVAVEGGGEACTGHGSDGRGGEHAMRARAAGGEDVAASARSATLRRIGRELAKNPMLQASGAGLVIGMSGFPLPEAVLRISSMLGSTCAPLALFSMGMALAAQISGALGPFSLRASMLPLSLIAVGKLFLYPLLAYFVMSLAGCTGVMLAAATVTFAMPVAVLVYILAERDGSCVAEISMAVVSTTALSLLTLPLVMAALSFVGLY
jgi:predicted permease